ncbi:MAG: thiol-disulfide isomerase/thioredoxin [Patiriisocius sp.]
MKSLLVFLLVSILSCSDISAQEFKTVKIDAVENILSNQNDTLYVLNFWATWCQPCIEELPYFEVMHDKFKNDKVKIILISLDFSNVIDTRLKPFLEKKELKSTIWLLDEKKANEYIPKVDDQWSGAIPFTVFSRGQDAVKDRKEGKLTQNELEELISSKLN